MKPVLNAVLVLLAAAGLGGCAALPSGADRPAPAQAGCSTCRSEAAGWSIAVTRPALCNDYPVSYRVQTGDADARIRPVERLQIVSDGGTGQPATGACCK
ncbi:MAG: hypothetical protein RLZZ584_335 [Pseudomonadota bacterium]|jgi:hypothetical protein